MLAGSGIAPAGAGGPLDAVARRKLNILRAMFSGGRVIILDEPTAALTVSGSRAAVRVHA
jgi:simple sugar transport system ATP-binding protein